MADMFGLIAPPSTITPSGGPVVSSHCGKRFKRIKQQSSYRRESANGEQQYAGNDSFRPSETNRVSSRISPTTPTPISRFEGRSKTPSVLERKKNTARNPGRLDPTQITASRVSKLNRWHKRN